VEETGVPGENYRHVASHIMLYTSPWSRFDLKTPVVIGTVCIGSCKSNYHTITATTDPVALCISRGIFSDVCFKFEMGNRSLIKYHHHDITETSLKVALSTIKQTNKARHDIIIFLLLLLNTFYIELKYLWTIKVENPLYRLKKPVISIK
jgi:hypothetical protein